MDYLCGMKSKDHINCLILEDEFYTACEIRRLIKEYNGRYNVTGILESCEEFAHFIDIGELPDLIVCNVTLADGPIVNAPAFTNGKVPLILTCVEESISLVALPNIVGTIVKPITGELLYKCLAIYEHKFSH